ncbi:class I SAM-dependent methyltransferase [bacterium]|nr:class I SAM-dependent methyltransferase [bacterium]
MKNSRFHLAGESQPVLPYQHIAGFYDSLMDHVDYRGWADYMQACFKYAQRPVRTVLDCGCGTGSLLLELQDRHYRVSGFDLSHDMLRMARIKGLFRVWQADMCQTGVRTRQDAVICLYDTFHYLTAESIPVFFSEVLRCMEAGGIFVFDAVTEQLVRTYWANFTERDEGNGVRYERRSWYDSENHCQHTEFYMTDRHGGKPVHEHHRQWIYPLEFIAGQAEAAGFHVHGLFDECTMKPGTEQSDRVHFVLSRRDS